MLDLHLSGSGTARIESVDAASVGLTTSGSGAVGVRGTPNVEMQVSGSGNVYSLESAEY